MSVAVQHTMLALWAVTISLPIGTNLALVHFLWMLVSGSLLPSRGALFPALHSLGLGAAAVRRAWAAFRSGSWGIAGLLQSWEHYVLEQQQWQPCQYDGYHPKAADLTAYWRPTLKGCRTKHYHPQAEKALPAVVMALIARVGRVGSQRVPLPSAILRADPKTGAESAQRTQLLREGAQTLAADEILVLDAGFKIRELQAAGVLRYLVRLAQNFTARRNRAAPYPGRGRKPEYGELVRPLARTHKGKTIPATPPDRVETWVENGVTYRAEIWDHLVLPDVKPSPEAQTFHVAAVYDPAYQTPWLLACPFPLSGPAWRGLYQARWSVEQVPLAAKQMLGAARQFVSAPESCQRLPELTLFAGALLTYLAAISPAIPTGFWDRKPKPTPGRFRRALERLPFPASYPLPERLRKKASVTAHLPKGILGHRRTKQATTT